MSLEVFIFYTFLTAAEMYCLTNLPGRKCHSIKDYSILSYKTTITECLDACLRNRRMYCGMVQWREASGQCMLTEETFNKKGGTSCFTFEKESYCRLNPDVSCLKRKTTGRFDQSGLRFGQIANEEECQSICLLSSRCTSYVYDSKSKHCNYQVTSGYHAKRQLRDSEVYVEKTLGCTAARCANIQMYPGVVPRRYRSVRHGLARTMYQCLKHIRRRKDMLALQWDVSRRTCSIFKANLHSFVRTTHSLVRIIEMTESQECNDTPRTREVCIRKQRDSRMRGGLKLDLKETECVGFCKLIVTCAAVDWDGSEGVCIFHFLNTELVTQSGWTNYQVIPCNVNSDYRIIRGGFLFARFKRRKTASINGGVQQKQIDVTSPCIECASMCSVENCPGFVCGEISGCLTKGVHNAMYVPLK